jgi:phosphatidylserine/phosphatidylglycerophosphate/cardiolipin synthase-like enzyme
MLHRLRVARKKRSICSRHDHAFVTTCTKLVACRAGLQPNSSTPLLGGNQVKLLIDTEVHYAAWLAAIGSARQRVLLESCIVRDDELARRSGLY